MQQYEVYGLYADSWQGVITEASFKHPAKFARGLIRWIVEHALEQGYLKPGDTAVDCFGGVALGALDCTLNGVNWLGVELEQDFVKLGRANIALWEQQYRPWFPDMGRAVLVQGDSRSLSEIVQTAGAVVSSPPYGDAVNNSGEGPGARFDFKFHAPDNATKPSSANGYGRSNGQLGRLDAAISSPPFEANLAGGTQKGGVLGQQHNGVNKTKGGAFAKSLLADYGSTDGNIGNDTGDTFWTAARAIVEQVYTVLRPGGVAVWVTGDFKRNGERVLFGEQWRQLCEACGFVTLEHIVAWKREPGPTQLGLLGDDRDLTIDRVSFFRRLSNQRDPENEIVNEDVWVCQKPVQP